MPCGIFIGLKICYRKSSPQQQFLEFEAHQNKYGKDRLKYKGTIRYIPPMHQSLSLKAWASICYFKCSVQMSIPAGQRQRCDTALLAQHRKWKIKYTISWQSVLSTQNSGNLLIHDVVKEHLFITKCIKLNASNLLAVIWIRCMPIELREEKKISYTLSLTLETIRTSKKQTINGNCLLRNWLPARLAQLIIPVTGWAAISVSIGK